MGMKLLPTTANVTVHFEQGGDCGLSTVPHCDVMTINGVGCAVGAGDAVGDAVGLSVGVVVGFNNGVGVDAKDTAVKQKNKKMVNRRFFFIGDPPLGY